MHTPEQELTRASFNGEAMPIDLSLHLPRNAFNPRDAARAGDIWRCCQDVAVRGSSAVGWEPPRFRAVGSAFVVREMTTVHHSEASYGDDVAARTWISSFRRGLLCTRQIRLAVGERPLASTTQEWAHVSTKNGVMRAARANAEVVAVGQKEQGWDRAPRRGVVPEY